MGIGEGHAFFCKSVEVRSLGMLVAVAAESRLQVVDEDQKNVELEGLF